jgi:hypothetical protein
VDSYGIWDLIYRYLLPGWWIIPIYTTITAWIATLAWWRRAGRAGRAWTRRLFVLLEDGPRLRLYAVRAVISLPLLILPIASVVVWYLLGCGIWAEFHDGQFSLVPNWINLVAGGYGLVGTVVVALTYGDAEFLLAGAFWYGALVGIPFALLGLVNLLFVLLELVTDILFGRPSWDELWMALGIIAAALIPSLSFALTGWTARIGWNVATGRSYRDDYRGDRDAYPDDDLDSGGGANEAARAR